MEHKSITIDGISYDISQFSQSVQQAVGVYNTIQTDLQKAQMEVIKNQAALQTIGNQITEAVRVELEEKRNPSTKSTDPV